MTFRTIALSAFAAVALSAGSAFVPFDGASIFVTEAAANETIASGSWTKKSFKVSGTWSIYTENGTTYVALSDDFKTRKAPDLKIFLSTYSASDANGKNATQGSVLISPLSSHKGGQVYEIPAEINVSDYTSILIHCEAYSKLWSAADL